VAAPSKVWVCGGSFLGNAGSNLAGSMDTCLLRMSCVVSYRPLRRADHLSRGVVPSAVCPV